MISSGQPTQDGGAPDQQSPFGNPFSSDAIGLNTTFLDDVAYYGQTHDIRNQAVNTTGYLQGTQKVTFYSVNAMGGASGAQVLASAAKYGGFEDRDGNNVPTATGQSCTYPTGSLLGTGTTTSSAEWDKNADCIPDTFFDAAKGSDLEGAIRNAIADILKRSASGTSVSVLATSSTGEGTIYQAYFFPSQFEGLEEIKWSGYTQGLFVDAFGNLREDTDADGKLIYENDYIVKTRYDALSAEVKADRYESNSDGTAKTSTPFESVSLKDLKPIWEAGRRLALRDISANPRNLLTWVDTDNDALVDSGEVISFNSSNTNTLAPYLRPDSTYTAANIVSFILGNHVSGMRERRLTIKDDSGSDVLKVWRYGDPVNSTPTVVGAPKERFDVIYGDASYTDFFVKWKNRRLVAYVGANDGMLHAFNGGFYHRGDDPSSSEVEHGYFTTAANGNSGSIVLGQELWGFIPYELLPHLKWLTQLDYTHVYYVDLKPKVTDVRIFTPDTDHPNGWGTVLIGGFRMGGSCGTCTTSGGAPPMQFTANFTGSGNQTRTFYTAYFVLDITNPERDPVLLWSYSSSDMGLSTSYPAVVRMNPNGDGKTSSTNEKWFVAIGSGVTGYDGRSGQIGQVFAIDLKAGHKDPNTGTSLVRKFTNADNTTVCGSATPGPCSSIGDLISLDSNLDFRTDTLYFGNTISNGASTPAWYGKMYRLTTMGCLSSPCSSATWGVGTPRAPSVLIATFPSGGTTKVGPITAAPTVSADDTSKIWVFFGTGRHYGSSDKSNADTQYLFGVKDPVMTGGCSHTSATSCQRDNVLDVSNAVVCLQCATGTTQVSGVSGVTTFNELVDKIQGTGATAAMDGWYTTLPSARERALSAPTVLGGSVFFTTFQPDSDICTASGGGYVYALFYKTGSAYKESVIGTYTSGSNTNVVRSMSLGTGLPSQMAVQIGAQGSGSSGGASSSGCSGSLTGFIQASTGALNQFCGKPALSMWSRYVSWANQRS
jgi:type IV pilus assembly protein PilY1